MDCKHTYIGATLDLNRRLRQHNGEIVGGAKATAKKKGQWERVLAIHGFPDQRSALKFEWRWKRNARYKRGPCAKLLVARDLLMKQQQQQHRLLVERSISTPRNSKSSTSMIPVSIIGCPIEFSLPIHEVFIETDHLNEVHALLTPGRIYTHPVLGNMTPESFQMDPETGHITKVFCLLMDHKKRR
jgi:predicted GIY-YIG superfamily endonuclease